MPLQAGIQRIVMEEVRGAMLRYDLFGTSIKLRLTIKLRAMTVGKTAEAYRL